MFGFETSNRPSPFNIALSPTPQDPDDKAVKTIQQLNFYLRLKHLRENKTIKDLERWSQCAQGLRAELERFAAPLGLARIPESDLAEFESLLGAASVGEIKLTQLPDGYARPSHFTLSFGNETSNDPLPLPFPAEAANGGGEPEVSPVYADTCAGCPATFGEGQGIAGTSFLSYSFL